MKTIAHYATALAAVLFMAVSVAGATDGEPQTKPEPEEFLTVRVYCQTMGMSEPPVEVYVYFTGSGDLWGASLSVLVWTDCPAAVGQLRTALEGLDLPCETSPVGAPSEWWATMSSACQATREELINVMGEVGRAVVTLPATPTP